MPRIRSLPLAVAGAFLALGGTAVAEADAAIRIKSEVPRPNQRKMLTTNDVDQFVRGAQANNADPRQRWTQLGGGRVFRSDAGRCLADFGANFAGKDKLRSNACFATGGFFGNLQWNVLPGDAPGRVMLQNVATGRFVVYDSNRSGTVLVAPREQVQTRHLQFTLPTIP